MEREIRRRAEERVERRINFFVHLAIYLVVNAGLFVLWYFVSNHGKGFAWFVIPLGGWGIGIVAHLLSVFVFDRIRERMIDREMERIKRRAYGESGNDSQG